MGDLPKIEQPQIAKPSAPGSYAPSSPFRDAADVLVEPYLRVDTAPPMNPVNIEAELPSLYEAIARMTIAQTFEQPGTIRNDGTKEPINPANVDPIESAILEFLKSRVEGATAGRIRADKKSLKSVPLEDIEFYLSVLVAEGKIRQDGTIYYAVDLIDP